MKKTILLFLIPFFLFSFSSDENRIETNGKIHVLIFGATEDSEVGNLVKHSIKNIQKQFKKIESDTNMDVIYHLDTGQLFNKSRLEWSLRKYKTEYNSVLVVYTISHGFKFTGDTSKFARLIVMPNLPESISREELKSKAVSVENFIIKEAKQKKARLKLVISESCSDTIGDMPNTLTAIHLGKKIRVAAYNKLFQKSYGLYAIASSSTGQKAWGTNKFGNFFTKAFFNALNNELEKGELSSWMSIFRETKKQLKIIIDKVNYDRDEGIEQEPYYREYKTY